jgi:anti-sigma factor ChrR (cupin superfamily)
MPRVLITPTFDRVLAYANGHLTSAADPVQQEAKERRAKLAEKVAD